MIQFLFFAILASSLFQNSVAAASSSADILCGNNSRSVNLFIQSQRNFSGEWVTTFSAVRDSDGSRNVIKLDLKHTVTECGGKRLVQIQGVLRDTPTIDICSGLQFHKHFAKNIVLTPDGKTAHRKNPESDHYYGTVLTHRPQHRNELFEVRLDKCISKVDDSLIIGVTARLPNDIDFSSWMGHMKSDTWLMYDNTVRQNGSVTKSGYGRSLRTLQVGDQVGVMVKNDDALHFYVNGVDQGLAQSNIPYSVYGFVDILENAVQATIQDNCK